MSVSAKKKRISRWVILLRRGIRVVNGSDMSNTSSGIAHFLLKHHVALVCVYISTKERVCSAADGAKV